MKKSVLGVNIDHVATLRQARQESYPDPIEAALIAQKAGAYSIVAHLREDRRHIQDKDILKLKKSVKRLNLEISLASEIVQIALKVKPYQVTLVPEKRQELTTEGGLDLAKTYNRLVKTIALFKDKNIKVNLFIDPVKKQLDLAKKLDVQAIELHTGTYATAKNKTKELNKIKQMVKYGNQLGLIVNVGHGLHYHNTQALAKIKGIHEFNIGHGIISHAVFVGLSKAVREMKSLINV